MSSRQKHPKKKEKIVDPVDFQYIETSALGTFGYKFDKDPCAKDPSEVPGPGHYYHEEKRPAPEPAQDGNFFT